MNDTPPNGPIQSAGAARHHGYITDLQDAGTTQEHDQHGDITEQKQCRTPADHDGHDPHDPPRCRPAAAERPQFTRAELRSFVEEAISAHDSRAAQFCDGNWLSPAWHLARLLMTHPAFDGLDADAALQLVNNTSRDWRLWERMANLTETSEADHDTAFYDAWERMRTRPGGDWLTNALWCADRQPIALPAGKPQRTPAYRRFLGMAHYLQEHRADEPIMLPVQRVAEAMGVDHHTVTRWRNWAKADGYLQLVREGSHARRRADEFRYLPPLEE